MNNHRPIAVLDSGLGGLTVVRSLRQVLPDEDILYFGDTARLPYGSKSPGVVSTFVTQIIRYLLDLRPKHVVVACNTATALCLPAIRAEFPELPITGVIDPGARAAVTVAGADPEPVIGVIATEATVRSQAYERAILRLRPAARLLVQPAPLLVAMIEEGRGCNDHLVRLAVTEYLQPLLSRRMRVLVLGCTHYPILRDLIEDIAGPEVAVVDSASLCAQDVRDDLIASGRARQSGAAHGILRCWVTDDSPKFAKLASSFLGYELPRPLWVSPDELPTSSPTELLRHVG